MMFNIKKVKFCIPLILILINFSTVLGQTQKEADNLLKINKYQEALDIYNKLTKEDYSIINSKAKCLKKLFRYSESEQLYKSIIESDNNSDETLFNYAEVLNILGKYSKAIVYYKKISNSNKARFNVEQKVASCLWAESNLSNKSEYKLEKTNIETGGISLGMAFYQDGLIHSVIENINEENSDQTLTNYKLVFSKKESTTFFSAPKELSNVLNANFYEGAPSIYNNELYFTKNNSEKETYKAKKNKKNNINSNGINVLQIFMSKNVSGSWEKPIALNFDNEYNFTHPCISEDGNTLYFCSDMPGGYGGYDIYYSKKNNRGEWFKPVNLGKEINTTENEMFPFLIDNKLYFSSRGHLGYGGADVFVSDLKDDKWSEPKNMGIGINSSKDDFSFILNSKAKVGYLTSNREGENGYDYIYEITPNIVLDSTLSSIINNFDNSIVALPFVTIKNEDLGELKIKGKDGKILIKSPKEGYTTYIFNGDGYVPQIINLDDFDPKKLKKIELTPLLRGSLFNEITEEAISGVRVYAIDKQTGDTVASLITKSDGKWAFVLPEDKAYDIVFQKEGFSKKTVSVKANERGDEIVAKLNKIVLNLEAKKGDKLEIRNIYFDYEKATLKPEGLRILDNIINYLKGNPEIKIELSAHSDSRGRSSYNLDLSEQRASAAVNYITSKGINKDRIISKGYGEIFILNKCKDNVNCSEEEHALNRRLEMKIL